MPTRGTEASKEKTAPASGGGLWGDSGAVPRAFVAVGHSASVAGQAMNRSRGIQAEFQFSIVAPHTAHSKLLISRSATMCSLRS
jgi:hypothetical protein